MFLVQYNDDDLQSIQSSSNEFSSLVVGLLDVMLHVPYPRLPWQCSGSRIRTATAGYMRWLPFVKLSIYSQLNRN
jgi:hypothetical protein